MLLVSVRIEFLALAEKEKKNAITIASSNHKHSDLCEPAHKMSQGLRIRTLQLLDNLETLVELSEHVHN